MQAGYAYLLGLVTTLIILKEHMRRPKFYRLSSSLMVAAILITFFTSAIVLLRFNPTNLDPTTIAVSVAILFYHLALSNANHNFYARYAKGQAFDHQKEMAIILGNQGNVVDFNFNADRWFSSVGIELTKNTYENIMTTLTEKGVLISEPLEKENGRDIFFTDNGLPVVLNILFHDLIDKKKRKHGSIVTFRDVTHNRELIEKLEKVANMDALCGLPNRTAYEGAKARFSGEEHLPLSVVSCDVNGLKAVNDTLGHKYGDLLIKIASEVLKETCPSQSFVARIGGDEFIFFLSRHDSQKADAFIKQVKNALTQRKSEYFVISAALGTATRHTLQEDLDNIIDLADSQMYVDKKRMKLEKL
ncbi:MAG: diguanylate cyclase [Treponema sp.]|nr:diguanylate cyclase [Treponema sp.]